MREHLTNYLLTLLDADAAKDVASFLQDPVVAHRFDMMEERLKADWIRFMSQKEQKTVIQKWQPPEFEAAAVEPLDTTPASNPTVDPVVEHSALPPEDPSPPTPTPTPEASAQTREAPQETPTADKSEPPAPVSPPAPQSPAASSAPPPTPGPVAPPASTPVKDRPALTFKLRNARQSEPYSDVISWAPADARIRLIALELPDELGMRCNLNSLVVEGTAKVSGEFSLPVSYRWADDSPLTERSGKISLYVNPDPKSLWKNLASDRSDPLWKEDEAAQIVCGEQRRIIAARKRGRSHAHVGSCCDDDFYLQHNSDQGWYLAIVADGAGSAKASRQGSRVAVRAAGNFLKDALAGEGGAQVAAAVLAVQAASEGERESARRLLHNALYVTIGHAAHRAMKALFDEAQARPELIASVKDLSTTLLIGVARQFGSQWLCAAYWVGDGAVGVYRRGADIQLLGEVDAGEYSGQTRFLDANEVSQEALLKRTRFTLCDDFTAFVLMTDGVSDPKFETEARLAELGAWDALWDELQGGAGLASAGEHPDQKLLEWLDFWSQGNHDDRTIALIY